MSRNKKQRIEIKQPAPLGYTSEGHMTDEYWTMERGPDGKKRLRREFDPNAKPIVKHVPECKDDFNVCLGNGKHRKA